MTHTTKYLVNLEKIRQLAARDNGKFLAKLDRETDWRIVEEIIKTQVTELSSGFILDFSIVKVFKIVLLGEIFKLEDQELLYRIPDRISFRSFVGVENDSDVPDIITLKKFKLLLRREGVYDDLLESVLDKIVTESIKAEDSDTGFIPLSQNELIDKKISEIEERIKKLHEKNLSPLTPLETESETESGLQNKLFEVENQVKNITRLIEETDTKTVQDTGATEGSSVLRKLDEQIYEKLRSIEKRLEQLDQKPPVDLPKETPISDSGDIQKQLSEITKELSSLERVTISPKLETSHTKEPETSEAPAPEVKKEPIEAPVKQTPGEPFIITPKQKTAGIFNDANLTEDYELGYRFFELGFKTGFFNIKVDKNDEASRIATAEFFPNTFWAAVKQRSRWIAGICFQNWSAHKWKGNIVTKYFLFRDRKSLFTFVGAFLSNIVFLYFLYAVIARALRLESAYSLVGHSSVLWYLMIANLVFMISRAAHRFAFTYNWYGFKYAFFSFFRLILDTFINFIAIIRSISVYRKTRKQVVWDSTSHY